MQATKAKQMNRLLMDGLKLLQVTFLKKKDLIQQEVLDISMSKILVKTSRKLVKEIK